MKELKFLDFRTQNGKIVSVIKKGKRKSVISNVKGFEDYNPTKAIISKKQYEIDNNRLTDYFPCMCPVCGDWYGIWECACNGGMF